MKKALFLLTASLVTGGSAHGVVILNEFNAVRSDRWLDADGLAASTASDSTFGRIEGNGGRWFELVVVGQTSALGETIDMRGWSFNWTDTDLGSGSFSLSNNTALQSIHRGTLITFFAQDAGGPNVASNLGDYNPAGGSWWLNVNLADTDLISGGTLLTGHSDWQLTVKDSLDNTIFGPVGEGVGTFSGVSSREVGKFEAFAAPNTAADWQGISPMSEFYNDGTSSSFGSANLWSAGSFVQDFGSLRAVPEPSTYVAIFGVGALGIAVYRRPRAQS